MSEAGLPIPKTALPHEVLREVLDALERGEDVVLASVVMRHGSAPSTPGQKLALLGDGRAIGTIGGGAVERVVLAAMRAALQDPKSGPKMETFRLGANLGMCCGGSVEILLEPLRPELSVLVVGAGHVGGYLAPLLSTLGFRVTLCDNRDAAADGERFRERPTLRVVVADHDDPAVLEGFPTELGSAAALVMTHDHQIDQAAIEWALSKGFGFVGGVGSRAKAVRTRGRLEAKGVPARDIGRVRMPIGLDIGARTPAEIGIAIAAELVAWRSQRMRANAEEEVKAAE